MANTPQPLGAVDFNGFDLSYAENSGKECSSFCACRITKKGRVMDGEPVLARMEVKRGSARGAIEGLSLRHELLWGWNFKSRRRHTAE